MSCQRALWVGEEISGDSDRCSLFMGVSEERRDGERWKADELGEVK